MREFSATYVPYRMGQYFRSRRAAAPAASSSSPKWEKTQFNLPPNESAPIEYVHDRPQAEPMTGKPTARHSLTSIASTFQQQNPQHEGFREEFGNGGSASRKTSVPGSLTEADALEGFQPSMLCKRSLPIYLLKTERFPQLHSKYMRGLTTWK